LTLNPNIFDRRNGLSNNSHLITANNTV